MLILKRMTVVSLFLLAVIFLWPKLALAQDVFGSNSLSDIAVYSTKSPFEIVAGIVNIILGLLGTITVLLFMYAGWLWLTSRGAADRIDQAKKIMLNASIGLGIIFVSYALVNFIFRSAYEAAFGGSGGTPTYPIYSGGVLGGVLEWHYPTRGATNIARNTNIVVTFREPIDFTEISGTSCDPALATTCTVNRDNIKIFVAGDATTNLADGRLVVTSDTEHRNFVFDPVDLLGNENTPVTYTVELNNLQTVSGFPVFAGGNTYNWSFAVGTWVDAVPPYVVSVLPVSPPPAPRNTIVQINFSESISPLEIPAISAALANITLTDDIAATLIDGTFRLSNQYKTVEFISNDRCGTNSCGDSIFCLPGSTTIAGQIEDVLRDMAGNLLDGNENGVHDVNDDYAWTFETGADIDLVGPLMISRDDNPPASSIYNPITMTFDSTLAISSVNYTTVKLTPPLGYSLNYWFTVDSAASITNNRININHDPMAPNTTYQFSCSSGITDLQQNCYECGL